MTGRSTAHIKALDLFAGTGWGVACKRLGIKEAGVEIMPEAIATRTANGMETIYNDVWDGIKLTAEQHRERFGSYGLLIASPPCQTFSLAGKGAGRAALDEVLEAIEFHAYKDADALLRFGEQHDMRTALVLTPLAYVWRDRPRLVAMEQVPTVLPVWEACAEVMRAWGYEVKVEILNAEQYGVPQTRKRAILVARRGGPASLPAPTHSKYYSTNPTKLDADVKKWVSMAEALGWEDISLRPEIEGWKWKDAPATTIAGDPRITAREHHYHGEQSKTSLRLTLPEATALQSFPGGRGLTDRPSPTITGGGTEAGGAEPIAKYHERYTSAPGWVGSTDRLTTDEAAALQSYPVALKNMGRGMVDRYGERPGRDSTQPAFTLRASAGGTEPGGFVLQEIEDGPKRKLTVDEASILQSYPTHLAASGTSCQVVDPRPVTSPAPTITGAGNAEWGMRPTRAVGARDRDPSGRGVTIHEAATIQSYEPPFIWCGTKTKKFLQIGNAVPPLMAEAILAALIGIRPGR